MKKIIQMLVVFVIFIFVPVTAFASASDEEPTVYIKRQTADTYWVLSKPVGGRFQLFVLQKEVDPSINVYNWRIRDYKLSQASSVNPLDANWSTKNSITLVTLGSQLEYALKEAGQSDFMGGYHGDEHVSNLKIYDGQSLIGSDDGNAHTSQMQIGEIREVSKLRVIADSTLNRVSSPSTKVANISRTYSFDGNGATIAYNVKWLVETQLDTSFVAMFPAVRASNVTTKARYLNNSEEMNVSAGFSEKHLNTSGVEFWNETNHMRIRVQVLDPKKSLNSYLNNGNTKSYITNSPVYNKFYVARVGAPNIYKTTIGQTWDVKWRVESYMPFEE